MQQHESINKYLIFVEGKADAVFVRDCLLYLYASKDLTLTKDDSKEKLINNPDNEIRISVAEGFVIATKLKTRIQTAIAKNYKVIFIQDADSVDKDPKFGGLELRNKYFEKWQKENNLQFESFLFPNNSDNGDLETLLLQIASYTKYEPAANCYKNYAECIRVLNEDSYGEMFNSKHLVFAYIRTYQGMAKAKEDCRNYSSEFWNFKHKAIEPFLNFLKANIQC